MDENLARWARGDQEPADFYELLGKRRFLPRQGDLLETIKEMTRELLLCQNRMKAEEYERFHRVQTLLGEAQQTFSDHDRWQRYDDLLLERLSEQYAAGTGEDPAYWRPENLRRWLDMVAHVHPDRLNELAARMIPESEPPQTTRRDVALLIDDVTEPAGPASSDPGSGSPGGSPATAEQPVGGLPPLQPTISTAPVSPSPQPGDGPAGQARQKARRTATAPPGSGRTQDRGPARKQGPRTRRKPPPPPLGGTAGRTGARPRRESGDTGLAWMIGSAIVTALVLGLICALIILPNLPRPSASPIEESLGPQAPPRQQPTGGMQPAGQSPGPQAGPGPQPATQPEHSQPASSPGTPSNGSPGESTETSSEPPASSDSSVAPEPTPPPAQPPSPHAGPVTLQHGQAAGALAFSPDGAKLAVAGGSEAIRIWNADGSGPVAELADLGGSVTAVGWSGKGEYIAGSDEDGTTIVWGTKDWASVSTLDPDDRQPVRSLAWLPGISRLVTGDEAGHLYVWDGGQGKQLRRIEAAGAGAIQSLCAAGRSRTRQAACGQADGSVVFWDVESVRATDMIVLADGPLWELATGSPRPKELGGALVTPQLIAEDCFDLAVSPDGKFLAVAHDDVSVWDMEAGAHIRVRILPGRSGQGYQTVAWRSDGKLLACGDEAGNVNVWESAEWRVVFARSCSSPVTALDWSPAKNQRLAIALEDGSVTILPAGDPGSEPLDLPASARQSILEQAEESLDSGDWYLLAKALNLIEMHRLSSADEEAIAELRTRWRREAQSRLAEIERSPRRGSLKPDEVMDLQQINDVDPRGTEGKEARRRLNKHSGGRLRPIP